MKHLLFACVFLLPLSATASDAKDELLLKLHYLQEEMEDRHWTFDNRAEFKVYEKKAEVLEKVLDMVVRYEGLLALEVCQGAAVVTARGVPVDRRGRAAYGGRGLRAVVIPEIRSAEVRLIERIVRVDHELEETRWTFDTRSKQRRLEETLKRDRAALASLHRSRCPQLIGRPIW